MKKYDDILLEAYESHKNGEITDSELEAIKEAVEEKRYNDFLMEKKNTSEKRENNEEKEVSESVEELANEVDKLRLSVYEAYKDGIISEEDKNTFLEHLDIDNYEFNEDN